VETYGKPALGGPWSLVDSEGRPFSSGDLLGQYYLLYFGFTYCPDICPNELVKMARVTDAVAAHAAAAGTPSIRPVFITVDPHRDSCAQVRLGWLRFTERTRVPLGRGPRSQGCDPCGRVDRSGVQLCLAAAAACGAATAAVSIRTAIGRGCPLHPVVVSLAVGLTHAYATALLPSERSRFPPGHCNN